MLVLQKILVFFPTSCLSETVLYFKKYAALLMPSYFKEADTWNSVQTGTNCTAVGKTT